MYFVAGTDTDSGKTLVSSALLLAAKGLMSETDRPMSTLGIKPIASGCMLTPAGLRNSDALQLLAASSVKLTYGQINPIAFEPAIAPHIAAAKVGGALSPEGVLAQLDLAAFAEADFCLIEGAGGWRLPLGQGRYLSELVQSLSIPVILVVGMKLGCLNHALLTQEAILADGLEIAGWVANCVDPEMSMFEENLDSLKEIMSAPMLGCIPFLEEANPARAAEFLSLEALANHN
ncbi:dethiobiotin synthase [Shewanella salipaludis]|uniref:ATP-dependent dethiobiotin synthetase BioD n=1 Tax=Shewanella salipaludis TaxID=2723052 RepID=A0A972JKE6_9GAMM|nr:dethiobiotin synthase [Shewanella salipaludis]NMH64282.1 dethiobiotin synthase [Shewanella salipaludis]